MDDFSELKRALAAHKIEIESLNGEIFATQTLLAVLLGKLVTQSPALVKSVFDKAANETELAAMAFGQNASPHHLARALKIIETIRSGIIPAQKPEAEKKQP